MTTKFDIYQDVTDRIVNALEQGSAPWLKPWAEGKCGGSGPHNATTGRAYSGINWLVLSCSAYTSDGWLTYKQATSLGGGVTKGAADIEIQVSGNVTARIQEAHKFLLHTICEIVEPSLDKE